MRTFQQSHAVRWQPSHTLVHLLRVRAHWPATLARVVPSCARRPPHNPNPNQLEYAARMRTVCKELLKQSLTREELGFVYVTNNRRKAAQSGQYVDRLPQFYSHRAGNMGPYSDKFRQKLDLVSRPKLTLRQRAVEAYARQEDALHPDRMEHPAPTPEQLREFERGVVREQQRAESFAVYGRKVPCVTVRNHTCKEQAGTMPHAFGAHGDFRRTSAFNHVAGPGTTTGRDECKKDGVLKVHAYVELHRHGGTESTSRLAYGVVTTVPELASQVPGTASGTFLVPDDGHSAIFLTKLDFHETVSNSVQVWTFPRHALRPGLHDKKIAWDSVLASTVLVSAGDVSVARVPRGRTGALLSAAFVASAEAALAQSQLA